MDIVVPVPRLPAPGETIIGEDSFRTPGGKGANQAVAAARLGQRVAMVGRVGGDDFGGTVRAALGQYGVDGSAVAETPETSTGIALIAVGPDGENLIIVSPGANARLRPSDVDAARRLLEVASVLLLQLEIPLETVRRAAERAAGTVILNPAPARTLPRELLEAVDVLVPNRSELAVLLEAPEPRSVEEVAQLAGRVEGPATVVVTLGRQGALLVHQGEAVHVPALAVRAVDTTAAGDCFCGAVADCLARGDTIEAAVRWAVGAAAVSTTRQGAQISLPTRQEVETALITRSPSASG